MRCKYLESDRLVNCLLLSEERGNLLRNNRDVAVINGIPNGFKWLIRKCRSFS